LQALRAGAKEFLTQPVVLEELLTALQRLRANRVSADGTTPANGAQRTESCVISILGSRGGVGCTSLAVNLGATLAQEKGLSVALIDLDLALGDADVALDLMPDYTLADVAMNIDRLDMTFLRRSLCKHATGLSLLPHPVQMEDISLIHEDHLQRVIGLLRASYTHLVFDLSKRFTPTDLTAMRMSDAIMLMAQLELTSLRNVVRMLHTLVGPARSSIWMTFGLPPLRDWSSSLLPAKQPRGRDDRRADRLRRPRQPAQRPPPRPADRGRRPARPGQVNGQPGLRPVRRGAAGAGERDLLAGDEQGRDRDAGAVS
jgi:Mrp family chromosome partitioning ATPase